MKGKLYNCFKLEQRIIHLFDEFRSCSESIKTKESFLIEKKPEIIRIILDEKDNFDLQETFRDIEY